jgi:acetyl-CoA carboxylase biotin carboxylase subunit
MQMQYIQDMVFLKIQNFKICQEHGIKFIGASPEMIDRMGDKASAKSTMIEAGVLVSRFSWYFRIIRTSEELSRQFGFQLLATAGGGGKGMRAVWKEEDLLKHGKDSSRVCCCFW